MKVKRFEFWLLLSHQTTLGYAMDNFIQLQCTQKTSAISQYGAVTTQLKTLIDTPPFVIGFSDVVLMELSSK